MTLMAEGYGADVRLVAFMQYLRVVMVTVVATLVASVWTVTTPHAAPPLVWFPPVAWTSCMLTAILAVGCAAAGRAFRIPAGALLVAMGAGAILQDAGVMRIELPPLLLAPAYLLVGWSIGGRFNRAILAHAAKAFPKVAASMLCLILACGGLAAALIRLAHVDALTAYLATESRRGQFGRHHRRLDQGGRAVRHGDADGQVPFRPARGPRDCALRRLTCRKVMI